MNIQHRQLKPLWQGRFPAITLACLSGSLRSYGAKLRQKTKLGAGMVPTDPDDEIAKGRIALWLSPEQIAFIANEWRKIPGDAPQAVKQCWSDIAFRAMTALHRAGITFEPVFPRESDAYHLTTHRSGPAKAGR
jgi:hypothetical protein